MNDITTCRQNHHMVSNDLIEKLINAVEFNDEHKICVYADAVCLQMQQTDIHISNLSMEYIKYRLLCIAEKLDNSIDGYEYYRRLSRCESESMGNLEKMCILFSGYLSSLKSFEKSDVTEMVKKEIDESFMGDISLISLGKKYYIGSAYLGQLFKRKYGVTFKDYLNLLRINEAARYISRENQMIKYAAKRVGYKNMDYFTKKFTELMGMTPAEYKKQSRNEMDDIPAYVV